jgi:hypothetical protein
VIFVLLILQRYLIVGFCGGGRESEGTVGLPLDMTTTRSELPTDIYEFVFIPNCWLFTFSVDTVATFVVTLEKGFSTAVCTKEV